MTQLQGSLVNALQREFAGRVETDPASLHCYAFDASHYSRRNPNTPLAVVFPSSTGDVQTLVRLCGQHEVRIVPRGAGTGQTGGAVPIDANSIVLDMSTLNQPISVDLANLQVTVQAGIVAEALNDLVASDGFFFPPDPGSIKMCTIGGMIANNASGMRAVKYGTTRNYVLGLEVVLADGSVITTGGARSRVLKTVSGYDLTALFVGSEGTLGIITAARIKVAPLPEARGLVLAAFSDLESAGRGVQAIFRGGMIPSALELMDRLAINTVINYRPDLNLPKEAEALLIIEVDGLSVGVSEGIEKIKNLLEPTADDITYSSDPDECQQLWEARRAIGPASGTLRPNARRVSAGEDIGVPMGRVPEALSRVHAVLTDTGVTAPVYGHVGDGNFHVALVADGNDEEQILAAERAADQLHLLALDMEGTTTGEHGVGLSRAPYMSQEHDLALETMRKIKHSLDPKGLLNAGKMGL